MISEIVFFIPDVDIGCSPPYEKGKIDSCWVKYKKGKRPNTKEEWESALGMSIQRMSN